MAKWVEKARPQREQFAFVNGRRVYVRPVDGNGNIILHPTLEGRDINGKLLPGYSMPGTVKITKENAREYQKKGYTKYREAAIKAMIEEFGDDIPATKGGSHGVWGFLVASQARKLHKAEKPHVDDLVSLGQIIGSMPRKEEEHVDGDGHGTGVDVLEQADKILSIIERAKALAGVEVIDVG